MAKVINEAREIMVSNSVFDGYEIKRGNKRGEWCLWEGGLLITYGSAQYITAFVRGMNYCKLCC